MTIRTHTKINKDSIITWFFLIPSFVPKRVIEGGIIKLFFNFWRIAAFILVCILLAQTLTRISTALLFSSMFSMTLLYSTITNDGNIKSCISIAMMIFTTIAISEIEIKKNCLLFLKNVACISWVILFVDCFELYTRIGYREADYSTWLGGDNFAVFAVLPMIGLIIIYALLSRGKLSKKDWAIVIAAILGKFYTFAVTSMLSFICFIVLSKVFSLNLLRRKSRTLLRAIIIIAGILIAINFVELFEYISGLFGKTQYIPHNRIGIWKLSIEAILKKPFLGYGVLSGLDEAIAISGWEWTTASHTHNYLLELLFRSGIIGTVFYIISMKDYIKIVLYNQKNIAIHIFRALLIANLVLWFTDSYYTLAPFYILIVLSAHINSTKYTNLMFSH